MNGHVFETYYECEDDSLFRCTVEMLGQYINKHLKYPNDMESINRDMEEPNIKEEEIGQIKDNEIRAEAIKQMAKKLIEWRRFAKDNNRRMFAVIWGQCSELLQAKL